MSFLWGATAAFLFVAALCCRVLIVTRHAKAISVPVWLTPALLALLLVAAGIALLATQSAGG